MPDNYADLDIKRNNNKGYSSVAFIFFLSTKILSIKTRQIAMVTPINIAKGLKIRIIF